MTRGGAAAGRAGYVAPCCNPHDRRGGRPAHRTTLVSDRAEKQGASAMVVTRTGRISRV